MFSGTSSTTWEWITRLGAIAGIVGLPLMILLAVL
jgi:hypothetical protein